MEMETKTNGDSNPKTQVSSSPYLVIPDDCQGYPLESFCISHNFMKDLECVLIPGGLIQDRTERLACDIAHDIGSESFTALCVLKGGYQFFSDLLQKIRQFYRFSSFSDVASVSREGMSNGNVNCAHSPQQIRAEFIRVKSYEDDASTGKVNILGIESMDSLKGANVLVVEDIIDSGKTMVQLLEVLKSYEPKSIRVASLFLKRNPRSVGYIPHYVGFEVPDKFLIGYNLDYNEYFRELNHVCIINEKAKSKYSMKKSTP